MAYYIFLLLILNSSATLLADEGTNNLVITHLLALGEFIVLSLFFKEILVGDYLVKKYFRSFLAVFGGLIILNSLFLERINTFNTNAKTLVLFVIIFLSTAFFYDRSIRLMKVDAYERALRIMVSAILIYYSGSFFVYLFYKFSTNNKIFYSHKMLVFNSALYLIFTALMLVAFSIRLRPELNKIEN